jgi:hypothetical protein
VISKQKKIFGFKAAHEYKAQVRNKKYDVYGF